ncbi:DUF481 domain-containing protein [Aeoliella sp. ICT_H6.2]|uniref:DUF481 domain-containing protein n=1 Tax=Aeoliella straminimaris TaxID=2954799 RepID=A0A9X2JE39_9BACT|nr:DUF481 domain-containing protein [Aeoliella straminimaris]MCO6042580.1 DUF481 domain-containing protein [Aeoliella straminimaris]
MPVLYNSAILSLVLAVAMAGGAVANPYEGLFAPPSPTGSTPEAPLTAAWSYPETVTPYPSTATPDEAPLMLESPTLAEPIPAGEEVGASDPEAVDVTVEVEAEPRWYYPSYWIQLPGWDTAVELGINGSSGTSDSFSIRTGGYLKRESDSRKVDFNIYLNRTQANGVETQNNAQMKFRHDWLLPESPWTVYGQTQLYYDRFQAFDLNMNLNGGLGYRVVDEDWLKLTGSFGAGTYREFGGPDDEWVPEAQFGFDYEQKLSETQKLTASLDYYPEWEDFSQYRMLTEIAWEVELATPSNVSLKFAANNRHDSDPQGANPNNFNYSVLLLWKL